MNDTIIGTENILVVARRHRGLWLWKGGGVAMNGQQGLSLGDGSVLCLRCQCQCQHPDCDAVLWFWKMFTEEKRANTREMSLYCLLQLCANLRWPQIKGLGLNTLFMQLSSFPPPGIYWHAIWSMARYCRRPNDMCVNCYTSTRGQSMGDPLRWWVIKVGRTLVFSSTPVSASPH